MLFVFRRLSGREGVNECVKGVIYAIGNGGRFGNRSNVLIFKGTEVKIYTVNLFNV